VVPAGETGPDRGARERILEAAYACVARFGLVKTTVEDVAKEAGISRASLYRVFPGGREQLLRETVAWEMERFFSALAAAVAGAGDFPTLVETGLAFARRAVREHAVLQKVLVTEPDRLLPLLTVESHRPLRYVTTYLRPYLERERVAGRLAPGVDPELAADYLARMLLSLITSPGRWGDLDDPAARRSLVRHELLGGILREIGDGEPPGPV
jgi:AcrR family transcriptional regulator